MFWRRLLQAGVLASALVGAPAAAAPFAGTGQAAIGDKADNVKARGQAVERARRAALEGALEQMGPAEPGARKRVLDEAGVWTRAYRVLQQSDDGATATAVVSVEIDTARLAKALAGAGPAAAPAPAQSGAPALAQVRDEGCPAGAGEALAQRMIQAGQLRDGRGGTISGVAVTLELRCRELGAINYPRGLALEAAMALRGGPSPAAASAVGFGPDAAAATADAIARLQGQVAPSMSPRTAAGVELRLAAPWPAARVRRLEKAIRESVIGVQGVRVAGVGGDGSVTLRVEGPLSAAELQERLAAVQLPNATLVVGEVEGPHVVHARLQ